MQVAEERLPGVRVMAAPVREYISGTVTSGILGYLRRIAEQDLPPPPGYNPDVDRVGAVGIESEFEELLRGQKGQRVIEEDVVGCEVRVVDEVQPAAPENLHLTLDFYLQKFVLSNPASREDEDQSVRRSGDTARCGLSLPNVKTGEIFSAMVSLPAYDNNLFLKSTIKQEEAHAISE